MRIGVLRGREDSFPNALLARINSMGRGVFGEFVQLGGTKLNQPISYRVIVDRMSHQVPYYRAYLEMAALQGTYCINNVFSRAGHQAFFAAAAAERLELAVPKTVVLPAKDYAPQLVGESLRNLWPVDFAGYLEHVGVPCVMRPAVGGAHLHPIEIHSIEQLMERYHTSGETTMMLQESLEWDLLVRVPTVGPRHARAVRYHPTPMLLGSYDQDYDALPAALRDDAEELALKVSAAFGYDMNSVELGVKDGRFYGLVLVDDAPDFDYRSLRDAHFPWVVEKMSQLVVDKALADRPIPPQPDWTAPA